MNHQQFWSWERKVRIRWMKLLNDVTSKNQLLHPQLQKLGWSKSSSKQNEALKDTSQQKSWWHLNSSKESSPNVFYNRNLRAFGPPKMPHSPEEIAIRPLFFGPLIRPRLFRVCVCVCVCVWHFRGAKTLRFPWFFSGWTCWTAPGRSLLGAARDGSYDFYCACLCTSEAWR